MLLNILILLGGLALLVGGGELLIRGAVELAQRLGVSPLMIGLTVVAFGTSAPELVVNLSAALSGTGDIAFGNVIGSNIANLALLLGLTALVRPLVVHQQLVVREIPMLVLASAAGLLLGIDAFFGHGPDEFTRDDGLVLLLLFGVFLYYNFADARRQSALGAPPEAVPGDPADEQVRGFGGKAILWVVLGLVLLVAGGQASVTGAAALARSLGVPEVIIGLTLVAVGTSLPELAASAMAARRGQTDIAVGNLVGSNLFNLLFILGLGATIQPLTTPAGGAIDLLVMLGLALVVFPLAWTQRTVARWEGALLLAGYAVYVTYLALRGG